MTGKRPVRETAPNVGGNGDGRRLRGEAELNDTAFLTGGGAVGALMRAHDWSLSPLGAPDTWPQSLRSVVGLLLNSRFPMFVAWGDELGFLYNDAYAEVLGAKHPQALGGRFREIWSEIWADIAPLIDAALAGEAIYRENLPLTVRRRGYDEQAWFTFSYSPVRDENGAVAGMFCAVTETTEQQRTAAALRESEGRFRLMADSSPALIWVADAEGKVVFANTRYAEVFGRPADDIHGDGWMRIVHPDDLQGHTEDFLAAFSARQRFRRLTRVVARSGETLWLHCEGAPRFDAGGAFAGYVGVNLDVSDAKRAEEHLRLMVLELNHRVKNNLATVQSVASQTLRGTESLPAARSAFLNRIAALATAHDILTREHWEGAGPGEIAHGVLDPLVGGDRRLVIDGPKLVLQPRAALGLSMAFHELGTNALKYGSLSKADGEVEVRWRVEQRELLLTWVERGGPPVTPPKHHGFGSRLLTRGLANELQGVVELRFAPGGLECHIRAPLLETREKWTETYRALG